jgi:hypothetical protein
MGDVLKVIAVAILVGAANRYTANTFASKAFANTEWSVSEFEFQTAPMEFPEPAFNFNSN